ncbi:MULTISPECIES: glycine betaine ABC transporter substrate-binding protein [unclassified Pseudomonas]|jgi:ABC-type proline/glycine betaine transport systems, periplasmic components|uniref:glycine betaine ABC transporter substrate-binding protein n=1 Tax=unclassified Pseudomonas TaxID=196821 RepID=UPI0004BC312D|nr:MULTISPECIES: glycine betaine ABC transporter substrate-binding protein [unclassified Pseudomonas]SME97340.1 glycine betaine/proline transport system substrate-binding protein [Pseudomonas sp. LAMO17WK12:I1]
MHKLLKVLAVSLMCLFAAFSHAAEKTTIKIGTLPWEDVMPISEITQKFLEKQGFTVELTTFPDWGIGFAALARGDVDLMVSHINNITADYWKKNYQRLEKVSVASHGLHQGIVVPDYMPIKSIDELNSIKDQVGGKIIGIESGAGIMQQTADAIKQYNLQYTLVDGSTAAMTAQLQSAIERKAPIVTMLWQPSWMDMKFKVRYLDDPKGVFPAPQSYYWIAKKGFSNDNSWAREAVASVFVPIDDITAINMSINGGMNMEQAVQKWWDANTKLINQWAVMSGK